MQGQVQGIRTARNLLYGTGSEGLAPLVRLLPDENMGHIVEASGQGGDGRRMDDREKRRRLLLLDTCYSKLKWNALEGRTASRQRITRAAYAKSRLEGGFGAVEQGA